MITLDTSFDDWFNQKKVEEKSKLTSACDPTLNGYDKTWEAWSYTKQDSLPLRIVKVAANIFIGLLRSVANLITWGNLERSIQQECIKSHYHTKNPKFVSSKHENSFKLWLIDLMQTNYAAKLNN